MNLDSNSPEFQRAWAKIVAQAWADENFKSRLMSNPAQVLRDHGIKVPEDAQLTIDDAPVSTFFSQKLASTRYAQAAGAGSPATAFTSVTFGGSSPLGQPLAGGSTSGTAGTAGSFGTICGTAACVLTAGSAGTAGVAPSAGASSSPLGQARAASTVGSVGSVCGTVGTVGSAGASSSPLGQTQAGGSTVGSAGTIGSVACICGTLGSFATTGTAGTAS